VSVHASHADDSRAFPAPDGITIVPFALLGMSHLSFVEGRIPPRPEPYPVHCHGSLEQVTYILAGEIVVSTWDAEQGRAVTFTARPGDAFVTLPLQTLSFANRGAEEARVLFICAPAYPPDDSDTRLMDVHRAPTDAERAWSRARHAVALRAFSAILEARSGPPATSRVSRDEGV
jgi:mannose-6-phosphate isomerase-like protein (cupin superfamily)